MLFLKFNVTKFRHFELVSFGVMHLQRLTMGTSPDMMLVKLSLTDPVINIEVIKTLQYGIANIKSP